MAVTFNSVGTFAHGTSSVAPAYPASIAAGDFLGLVAASGEASQTIPAAPAGWTLLGSWSGGPGAFGVDDGPRRVTVWWRQAVGGETGTQTVTLGGSATGRVLSAGIFRLSKSTGNPWGVAVCGGVDTTDATSYSVTGDASITGDVDGHVMLLSAWHPDSATASGQQITWAGCDTDNVLTFSTASGAANTGGNDVRINVSGVALNGDAAGVPVYAGTLTAAGGGATAFLSISDAPAANQVTGTAHADLGGTHTVTGVRTVQGAASASLGGTSAVSGTRVVQGAASSSLGGTSAATGVRRVVGSAAAELGFTAEAIGTTAVTVEGTASADLGFTAAAAGITRKVGAASASLGFSGAIQGVPATLGALAASLGFSAAAQGVVRHVGAASADLGPNSSAEGIRTVRGTASSEIGGGGHATGTVSEAPGIGLIEPRRKRVHPGKVDPKPHRASPGNLS